MAHQLAPGTPTLQRKRTYPSFVCDPSAPPVQVATETPAPIITSAPSSEDDSMNDQTMTMFTLDDRKCPCLLCAQGPPLILQRESVAWTSIIRVAFYVLHNIYPDLPYLSMKTHVSPYILRHWQALGIDKKGDNVKWKKHILDAIWHGDSFFESGTPILKQTGVWRLINPKADPWLDSPSSSPLPRRKNALPKKVRSSPTLDDLPPQEFATSEPGSLSPQTNPRGLSASAPQALPHISSLLKHVDDYWYNRSVHKSPPVHRRPVSASYSPYRSPPMENRASFSPPLSLSVSTTPTATTPCSSPIPMSISPTNVPVHPNPFPSVTQIPPNSPLNQSSGIPQPHPLSYPSPSPTLPSIGSVVHQVSHQALPPNDYPLQFNPLSQTTALPPFSPTPISPFTNSPHYPQHIQHVQLVQHTQVHAQHVQHAQAYNYPDVSRMNLSPSPTRALHSLPCVSSLFQPTPLPSIYPTSC